MPATYSYYDAGIAIVSWYQASKGLVRTQRLIADGRDGPGAAENDLGNCAGTWNDLAAVLDDIYVNGVLP